MGGKYSVLSVWDLAVDRQAHSSDIARPHFSKETLAAAAAAAVQARRNLNGGKEKRASAPSHM